MSKIKALITTLVLGTSSAATAAPSASFSADASWSWGSSFATMPNVRDHREDVTSYRPSSRGTWIALTDSMIASRARTNIRIAPAVYSQLKLQGTRGASYIESVGVRFTDGTRQVVSFNRWIDGRSGSLTLNINGNGRSIDRVIIAGSATGRGAYQLFGYGRRISERPPVYQPPVYQPPVVSQPPVVTPPVNQQPTSSSTIPLANNLSFANTYGSKELVLDGTRRFTTLRLIGLTGSTPFHHVLITFANGHQQMILVGRYLVAGVTDDLALDHAGGSAVTRVAFYASDVASAIGPSTANTFNVAAF